MNNNYIGIFDSGMGGLSVTKEVIRILPHENIIYFGDTAHVPYGTRSAREIISFVKEDVDFLMEFDPKAIVIACNTADAVAKSSIEKQFHVPIYGVVEPAARFAANTTKNKKIGIIATNATVDSHTYSSVISSIDPDISVYEKACPLLVPLVEEGRFARGDEVVEKILRDYLKPLQEKQIDTLVLGCTHYPLLMDYFKDIMKGVTIVSSSTIAAENLKAQLKEFNTQEEKGDHRYFVSGDEISFEKNAVIFMDDIKGKVNHANTKKR